MKKNMSNIIAVTACVAIVVCLFQNVQLKRKISNLENNLSNQIMNIDNRINNIYGNIDHQLEEQEHLLAVREPEWSDITMNLDTKTADMKCAVSPKEFQQGVTMAVLSCNGNEYPMTFEDGKFVASLQLPLFEESRISKVSFCENGIVRTQALDWYMFPRELLMPSVYINTCAGYTWESGKKPYMHLDGEMEVQIEQKGHPVKVQSISLLVYIEGKEEKRIKLPANTKPTTSRNSGNHMEQVEEYIEENQARFYCPVDEKIPFPLNSEMALYIEVADDSGLCYRTKIESGYVNEAGNYDGVSTWGDETSIFSKDGKKIY